MEGEGGGEDEGGEGVALCQSSEGEESAPTWADFAYQLILIFDTLHLKLPIYMTSNSNPQRTLMWVYSRGKTLCQNNRQLIGMSLIGLARQAKNRSQLYFLLKSSLSIWAYGGVKDHIMEL